MRVDMEAVAFFVGGAIPFLTSGRVVRVIEHLWFNVDNTARKTDIWFVTVDRITSIEDVFQ